jgi:hypothetical protein
MEIDKEALLTTAALATKKTAFGSSLLSSMVIFTDPAYIIIAGLGAFVSMGSAYYDFDKARQTALANDEPFTKSKSMELGKAFVIGAIFTLLSFMLFHQVGMEFVADNPYYSWLSNLLPSFWLVVTVALATESVTIWDTAKGKIKNWFKKRGWINGNS